MMTWDEQYKTSVPPPPTTTAFNICLLFVSPKLIALWSYLPFHIRWWNRGRISLYDRTYLHACFDIGRNIMRVKLFTKYIDLIWMGNVPSPGRKLVVDTTSILFQLRQCRLQTHFAVSNGEVNDIVGGSEPVLSLWEETHIREVVLLES